MGVRSATRTALVTAIRARIPDERIGVDRSFPGPNLQPEHIYVDRVEGESTLLFIEANRHEREDTFRILIEIQATHPGQSSEMAEKACEGMKNAVLDAVAEAQLPGGLLTTVEHLEMVDLGQDNGPDAEPTLEGWIAFAEVEIACTARIQ